MIHTIGYAGHSPDSFAERLQRLHIDTLIDVRYSPISRRRGFSKSALARKLEEHGIGYVHLKDLGAPKALRELLAGMRDYALFFSQYRHHAEKQEEALR